MTGFCLFIHHFVYLCVLLWPSLSVPLSDCVLTGRWNPRSEHLQRKTLGSRGRTGSLDELEEFARSYGRHGRRGNGRDLEHDYDLELRPRDDFPTFRDHSPRRYRGDDDDPGWHGRHSPPPSPRKRRDTGDSERPIRRPRGDSYDDAFLNTLLERKARGGRGGRGEDDSDTPSKSSSKKSSDCYYSRSPSNRPEEDDPLPPYTELVGDRHRPPNPPDRYRTAEPGAQPFSYTRPPNGHAVAHTLQERRDDRDKSKKVVSYL